MTIDMNDDHLVSVAQLREFAKLSNSAKFKSNSSKVETYKWVEKTLGKFRYFSLKKLDRGIIKKYVMNMTGYSEGAVDKLIAKKKKFGRIIVKERTQNSFITFYEPRDISLLADVNNITLHQNGRALKEMCKSMYNDFNDLRFEKLARISVSHLYNLKKTRVFESKYLHYTKTNPVKKDIGERRKPRPDGMPGFIRVDSVHQGDLDKEKGVYHINLIDEVTQVEYIGCVEGISEFFLLSLLQELINTFPFKIISFHSDNGSEYINHQVAKMLQKMYVDQTKSRSRHSNDNALVEGKNGAIIRKYMGYSHIPKEYAKRINIFDREYLNPYINFHRFCGFATDYVDMRGKIKKKYEIYMTPIQKLLSLPNYERYLKEGITKESLITETRKITHFESAQKVFVERQKLFKEINRKV
ncbi:MAG: integrase [Candidatus Taylorbacteria bacterium]|nr:integrase [Candidatus Taylorbacteria bacterium]